MSIVSLCIYVAATVWLMTRVHRVMQVRAIRRGLAESDVTDPILDPGSHPAPPDLEAERSFHAAWLKPNEEFILETDKILNDIEWARLTDSEQRVRKAREAAEHQQMHRDNPGAIFGCCINIGVGPGGQKPEFTLKPHDQGEAVFR